jgi:hypothetical protein
MPRRIGVARLTRGMSWPAVPHPDLSNYIVHFTSRGRSASDELPTAITRMDASERLASILGHRKMYASRPWYAPHPVICGTEATFTGYAHLISDRGYEPWGVVFHKTAFYAMGGRPVWYASNDEYEVARERLPAEIACRLVRYALNESDWTHEREWRIPAPTDTQPWLWFDRGAVAAIIVGDTDWPPEEEDIAYRVLDLDYPYFERPEWAHGLTRWWYNPLTRMFYVLPPV